MGGWVGFEFARARGRARGEYRVMSSRGWARGRARGGHRVINLIK
jgi:hypothetical protein